MSVFIYHLHVVLWVFNNSRQQKSANTEEINSKEILGSNLLNSCLMLFFLATQRERQIKIGEREGGRKK